MTSRASFENLAVPAVRKGTAKPRRPRAKALRPLEGESQRAILDVLECVPGVFAERSNTGVAKLPGKGGKLRPVTFGMPGGPDIRCCVRTAQGLGIALALEVKRPREKQNDNQIAWERDFVAAGGIYRVVTSPEEALAAVAMARKATTPQEPVHDICGKPLSKCLCRESGGLE